MIYYIPHFSDTLSSWEGYGKLAAKLEWQSVCAIIHRMPFFFILNIFISPLFNEVGKLRTSSRLQLRPGQDKAKQFDTYNNTELHME